MLPKVKQFWNNENNPLLSGKKQGQLRSDRIDRQYFGKGTYEPITKSDVTNQSSLRGIGMDAHSRSQASYSGPGYMGAKRRRDAGERPPGSGQGY